VFIGGTGGPITMGFGRTIRAVVMSPFVGQRIRSLLAKANQEDLVVLKDMIESGRITPVVDRVYPLSEVPEAISSVGEGRSRGKRVITI
jgi:NADPH:quinone reductase-like Zn-dependent oxidoreductase